MGPEESMNIRRISMAVSSFSFAIAVAFAATVVLQPSTAQAGSGGTCATKHCNANTHCCYGCTASPICVRNGVPCPECAPM